ncbi:holin [Pseudomonas alloputida]|uniref:phage holin family protein n=1 Tax=Pseudomonas alloputida TaxID=1940621 RepID=UPI001E2AC24F|nr:phage holin family protein [Pseudomonas alloputida]MCE0904698.1 holin [Pseudomonas alloputida]
MNSEQQALVEMPIWLVIFLSLVGGVSGEMWRADMAGVSGWFIFRQVLLRSGACVVCGLSTIMLLYSAGMSMWSASAIGCLTATAGADVAIGLYKRWVAKRLGVCDVQSRSGETGQ